MAERKMATQIRLDEYLHAKVKRIAELEMRSLNAQMEYFIAKSVERYEENGKVLTDFDDDSDDYCHHGY